LKKLGWGKARVEDQGRSVMIRVQLGKEGAQDRRLSRSHRSRQGNEPDAIVNAVQEVCKRFPMAPAHEEKAGVRGQTKRLFPETMKIEIHHMYPFGRQVFRKSRPMDGKILPFIPAKKGRNLERTVYSPNLYHI
jgi:hypothetical protein